MRRVKKVRVKIPSIDSTTKAVTGMTFGYTPKKFKNVKIQEIPVKQGGNVKRIDFEASGFVFPKLIVEGKESLQRVKKTPGHPGATDVKILKYKNLCFVETIDGNKLFEIFGEGKNRVIVPIKDFDVSVIRDEYGAEVKGFGVRAEDMPNLTTPKKRKKWFRDIVKE